MKRPKPDTRPRWNDPNLKVLYRGRYYSAKEYRVLCERAMVTDITPNWKHDKTYNLKAKKEIK